MSDDVKRGSAAQNLSRTKICTVMIRCDGKTVRRGMGDACTACRKELAKRAGAKAAP